MSHNVHFIQLTKSHFPLLQRWLNKPHVAAWWRDKTWTEKRITKKYTSYLQGVALFNGQEKPIHPYIITLDNVAIGYIQYYNYHDYNTAPHTALPRSLAGCDFYIGETKVLGKGIGTAAFSLFIQQHITPHYDYTLVDPNMRNEAAIKIFTKAGFSLHHQEGDMMYMVKKNS